MFDNDGFLLAFDEPFQMHEAGAISSRYDFYTLGFVLGDTIHTHTDRDIRFVNGKGASKATALVGALQFYQL